MSTLRERIEAVQSFLHVYPAPSRDVLLSISRPHDGFDCLCDVVENYQEYKDIHKPQFDAFIERCNLGERKNEILSMCWQAVLAEKEDNKNSPNKKLCSYLVALEMKKKHSSDTKFAHRV